ncbi:phosphotransferase [Pararhizobium sp. LjRoot255]|uniref:phosphotransferase n=1 Tax=Pararhizobium sp. LjRoot255 TaxID=3342298 RepID=UPI003ECDA5AC
MAVFTDLSDNDSSEIAAAYGMGALTSVIGIADGDTETTYLFRSQRGEFIVTLFENSAEPFELERAFRTMETLSAAGVPCPKTLRTEEGRATIRACGKLVAVVGFVEGSPAACAGPAKCADLGRRVAQIHRTLMRACGRPKGSLPRGPIHGALSPDNVFFLDDAVSGIINFRLRHDDVLAAELADMLVSWTVLQDGTLDVARAQAILAGYSGVRALDDGERQALPGFVLAAAARLLAESKDNTDIRGGALNAFRSAQRLSYSEPSTAGVA